MDELVHNLNRIVKATTTMKPLNLSFILTIAVFFVIGYIARSDDLTDLRGAQSAGVKHFVNSVQSGDAGTALAWGKVTDQALNLEVKVISNMTIRAEAPQAATRPAMDKAVALARKAGVSSSVIAHSQSLWAAQPTIDGASAVIIKLNEASDTEIATTASAGSFRRFIPAWAGGTTAFANWLTPRAPAGDITSDPVALARLSAALRTLQQSK